MRKRKSSFLTQIRIQSVVSVSTRLSHLLCSTWTVYRTQANKKFLPTSTTLFILALTSNRLIHKLFGSCLYFATKLGGYCNTFAPYVTTKTRPTLTQEKHHRRQPNSSIKTANLPSHTGVNRFKEIRMFWCPPERPKLKQSFFFHWKNKLQVLNSFSPSIRYQTKKKSIFTGNWVKIFHSWCLSSSVSRVYWS